MKRKFLGAALVVAWGLGMLGSAPAIAQNAAEKQNATENESASSGDTKVDVDRPTPASTTDNAPQSDRRQSDSDQKRNEADWRGDGDRDRNRSGSNDRDADNRDADDRDARNRASRNRNESSNDDRRSNDRMNDRSRSRDGRDQANYQGNSRRDSQRGRGGRDWQSDIRFGQPTQGGLAIVNVGRGTAFYDSGLRQGDVIVTYNGRPIRSEVDFARWAMYQPGQRVPVVVLRDGRRETVYITYEDRTESYGTESYGTAEQSYDSRAFLGVRFETRIRDAAVISSVIPGSPADDAGLQPGDELIAINGRDIASPREATRIVSSMQPGDRIDIEFARRMEEQTQAVLESRPNASQTADTQRTETQVFRGGPNYEQSAQPDAGQESLDQNSDTYDNSGRIQERGSNRRGGGLLPRLRN